MKLARKLPVHKPRARGVRPLKKFPNGYSGTADYIKKFDKLNHLAPCEYKGMR